MEFWSGLLGVVVGGGLTMVGQWIDHQRRTSKSRELDIKRKALLREMLDNPGPTGWREMSTMSAVIGASREETARLLIELGARASESGKDVWAPIDKKPLPMPKND